MNIKFLATAALIMITAAPAYASNMYINGPSKYGCADKDYYDKTVDIAAQGDGEAL